MSWSQPADPSEFLGSLSTLRRFFERSPARFFLTFVASFFLLLFALYEALLGMPVDWRLYLAVVPLFAVGLLRRKPLASRRSRIILFATLLVAMAALYVVPWHDLKPFLRDLDRVKQGMTEADVRRIMGRYKEGTNWPGLYGVSPEGHGIPVDVGSGAVHAAGSTPDGKLTLKDSLIFRPRTDGVGDANWGIVTFDKGTVVAVSFSAD